MKQFIPTLTLLLLSSANAQQAEPTSTEISAIPNEVFKTPKISNQSSIQSVSNEPVVAQRVNAGNTDKSDKSEFQAFVQYSTGKILNLYGQDFFSGSPSSFAPLQNTPLPTDYALGPGDEVVIRAWGGVDIDYKTTIDRSGNITLPTVGTISLAGVKAGDAESVIKASVAKLYRDFSMSVTFGRLRAITVYVVGHAKRPGSYTVSGFSTLVTALLASGGPNSVGSMRNVQVKRNGKTVGNLDIYSFIAKGDKSGDIKLQDGDTIFIPAAIGHIALTGKVNTPAIYELKSQNEALNNILEIAGGLPVIADPRRVFLERIDPTKSQPRNVEEFKLDNQGLNKSLKSGDIVTISPITPDFSNAVSLRGNVNQQLRIPYTNGMRIRDLIPNREALTTRATIARRNFEGLDVAATNQNSNSIAARIGNLSDEINWEYAVIERTDKETQSISLVSFNLGRAMADINSPDNLTLQPGDVVTVFSQNDIRVPASKRKVVVRVEGEVNIPGVYEMTPGDTIQSLIAKAGGATNNAYIFGAEFYREQVRKEQQINLEKAVRRLEAQVRSENVKVAANDTSNDAATASARIQVAKESSANAIARLRDLKATGRISLDLDPSENNEGLNKLPILKLENGDQLIIPSRPDFVHIFGAVNQESSLIWQKGATVDKYLQNSGLTPDADTENIFILRANGTVLSSTGRGWFSSINSYTLMPGDTIVVPERLNKETPYKVFTSGLKDWAQILSGFGISAAAIKSLRQ
ncbi:polysaccharide biosynthesis/export family protein [Undibacterium squillarum]|nr:SLBB domain-containing protein [Undibacterium squillarum]